MPRHPRRTADQWRALIEQHSQGSLSLAEFCRKKKLSPSNFHRWRRKLQQDEGAGFLRIVKTNALSLRNPPATESFTSPFYQIPPSISITSDPITPCSHPQTPISA